MARIPLQPETRAVRAVSLTVMSLMVAVGIIALAGAAAFRHVDLDWRRALSDRWTIEIQPTDPGRPIAAEDIARVMESLSGIPGILQARALEPQEVRHLLQPWLGDDAVAALPMPTLIDVRIDSATPPDSIIVAHALSVAMPGAKLDDHGAWTRDLVRLAQTGEGLGLCLFAVIMLTMVLIVAATARARLAINRPEIELLHQIGASDGYIARQFQTGAFVSAAAGAIMGALISAGAGFALIRAGGSFAPLIPQLRLDVIDWAVLAAAPLGAVILATLVARGAVQALVRRLP
jgi:cell division transport system permease protein